MRIILVLGIFLTYCFYIASAGPMDKYLVKTTTTTKKPATIGPLDKYLVEKSEIGRRRVAADKADEEDKTTTAMPPVTKVTKKPKVEDKPKKPVKSPSESMFFRNTQEWLQNFQDRFQRTIKDLPKETHCGYAAVNLRSANKQILEIQQFNSRNNSFLKNNDYHSTSYMGYQEGRLNRLGLFLFPVTWSAVRCGAGILTNDCGEPYAA